MVEYSVLLNKIAATDDNVLLFDETGLDWEIAARSLHQASSRKSKPFQVLPCTGLSDQQFHDLLFGRMTTLSKGYEPGALELADHSSLCLASVDELSLSSQSILMHALEVKTFIHPDTNAAQNFDVRIIACCSRDLKKQVSEGAFRADLYHRLDQQVIHLPNLNERTDEIGQLARQIIKELGAKNRTISDSGLAALEDHEYTGGVTELKNIITRAITWFDHRYISGEMVRFSINEGRTASNSTAAMRPDKTVKNLAIAGSSLNQPLSLKDQEKHYWQDLLKQVNGDKQKAAEIAGISLRTLYRRMDAAGLPKRFQLETVSSD